MIIILETDRLKFAVPLQSDYQDLLALRTDPDVMHFVGISALEQGRGQVQTPEQVQEHIDLAEDYFNTYGLAFFCVFEKKTNTLVGQAGLFHLAYDLNQPEIELAYRFHKKYWGKGYATEASKGLIEWGFNEIGLSKLIAIAHPENTRSINVMTKSGMSYKGDIDYRGYQLPCYEVFNKNVPRLYDEISDWYVLHRNCDLMEKPYLDKVISLLKPNAEILDIGCGTGDPIARYFIEKGFSITGIDGSENQLNKFKASFPNQTALCQDMLNINIPQKFDCIVAWHSLFHLTIEDQKQMFKVFSQHIKPNGILIFTTGSEKDEVYSDNGGKMLYHSSLDPDDYQQLLGQNGFKLLDHKLKDKDCGGATIWLSQYTHIA
jgi:RimJ/RimL family protein N-acetyltransferase